jgi:hypothetical protein
MTLSKTAAIREARTYVSLPHRRSATDYVVYSPYRHTDPTGPSTEMQADSYPKALGRRTEQVAYIALTLMGIDTTDVWLEAGRRGYDRDGSTVEGLVADGLKQAGRQ